MRLRFAIRDLLWLTVVIAAISAIKLQAVKADDVFTMKNWAPEALQSGPGGDTQLIRVHGLRRKFDDRVSIPSMTIVIGIDNPLAPLPRAGSARYSAVPPCLYEGDMVPISGQLYAVAELAQPRNDGSDAFIELHRVEYERYPEDVFPPSLTAYPFPLNEDTKSRGQSGTLNGYYIFVKEIKRAQRLTEVTCPQE